MNREIKFRGWDGKMMIPHDMINFGEAIENHNEESAGINEITLMQFTGLKDKNGLEIYEGDLIEIEVWKDYGFAGKQSETHIAVISFESGCFWWTSKNQTDCNWHFYNESERKIIGNVFENPEIIIKSEYTPHPSQ